MFTYPMIQKIREMTSEEFTSTLKGIPIMLLFIVLLPMYLALLPIVLLLSPLMKKWMTSIQKNTDDKEKPIE